VWVQVESLPAGEQTTIWVYYGNAGATAVSDEFAPFTHSTMHNTYYVVNDSATEDIAVYSLIDNNQVAYDGVGTTTLNKGESMTITTYDGDTVISTLGPITSRQDDNDGEPVVPISWATTTFSLPTERQDTEDVYVLAPFAGGALVDIYNGPAVSPSATLSLATGVAQTGSVDFTEATHTGTVSSTQPVLVYVASGNNDTFVAYPPTTADLYGYHSNDWWIGTAEASVNYSVYCSGGGNNTSQSTTRGVINGDNICSEGADATGDAVRIADADGPVAVIQEADSDGTESSTFLPDRELGTDYYIATAADYVVAVCSPYYGATDLEIYNGGTGSPTETATCSPSGELPGIVRFSNGGNGDVLAYSEGTRILSTNGVPFHVVYDNNSDDDETNTWSAVQGRQYNPAGRDLAVVFGEQELAIAAEFDQISYAWYQNIDDLTPTTTWAIGDSNLVEAEAITGLGAVDNGDVMRLRMNVQITNATATTDNNAFKLQYAIADTGQCSLATAWYSVGDIGSTTAAFSGYDNTGVSDGTTLSSTTLSASTDFATYEERNISNFLPIDMQVGDIPEWDWVITATNIAVNTNYCFRMVQSTDIAFETYTLYPELETVGPPETPQLFVYFDNEHTPDLSSVLEFAATDIAGDEVHYEVEIDDDPDFGSVDVNRDSETNFLEFENVNDPADKAPFNQGQLVRFTSPTPLADNTTYWWRVRASDPNGSATSSDWSSPYSFTTKS